MPQVLRDSSLNPGIVNQNASIFDYPNTPAPSILPLQVNPTQPLPGRTSTATGLLFPDLLLSRRLAAFPEQVWNLTSSSLLVRLMSVLLGPAGAGQLRQRQQVTRLQGAISGTHFFDLDAFYGALFSARRSSICALPANPSTGSAFNPYTDLATADGWDDIHAADARFRERVIQLARAISMGGTVPGLQALAEAIVRVPCCVYETGQLMTLQGIETLAGYTWLTLGSAFPSWASIAGQSWAQTQATVSYGGMSINARNEVVIQPQKTYAPGLASQQEAVADASGIMTVVQTLAPAFSLVSVNTTGALVDSPVAIAALAADSDYWEVIAKALPPSPPPLPLPVPTPQLPPVPYIGYVTAYDRGGQKVDSAQPMKPGVPAFSQSQGCQYSYAACIAQSFAATFEPSVSTTAVLKAPKNDTGDYETVVFPGGATVSYVPAWGVMDPQTAAAGQAASSTSMIAAPYSGPRSPVLTAGL